MVILVKVFEKLDSFIVRVLLSKDVVELQNEVLVGGDVSKETFWNEDATVVLTLGSSVLDEVSNSSDDVRK